MVRPAADVEVSVIIPVRNGMPHLAAQLAALSETETPRRWEVVVADNGSTDGTVTCVAAAARGFPCGLRVVDASRARGANVARNEGAAIAAGSLLLFCDADDIVHHAWVERLAAHLEQFDVVGGRLELHRFNPPAAAQAALQAEFPPGLLLGRYPWVYGANMGVRREIFERVGGFDEEFSSACDEVEFCARAAATGARIGYCPEAIVHYRLRPTTRSMLRQAFRYGSGEAQFRRRHGGPADRVILWDEARIVLGSAKVVAGTQLAGRPRPDALRAALIAAYRLGLVTRAGRLVGLGRRHGQPDAQGVSSADGHP